MFVKLFTTQLNKIVSKRLCINSVCDDLTLIRHDHVSWSPSRLTAEIQRFSPFCSRFFEFLALVFDKWWNTKKSLGVFILTFSTTTNDANYHIYYRTLTSFRAGFDHVWGTPTWRIATVVKRRVTWVKTKNRWFTVTLQCVSIQVSIDFPGYLATCSQHRRCDTVNKVDQFSSAQWAV